MRRAPILVLLLCLFPDLVGQAHAEDWSTLFTAQDVRDHLATAAGRDEALAFCRKLGLIKVYVEAFRDGYQEANAAQPRKA